MYYRYPSKFSDVFRMNADLNLVEVYKCLKSKRMCFVMLVADNKSPFAPVGRLMGDEALRRKAALKLEFTTDKGNLDREGNQLVSGEIPEVENAIKYYRDECGADPEEMLQIAEMKIRAFMKGEKYNGFVVTAKDVGEIRMLIKDRTFVSILEQRSDVRKMHSKEKTTDEKGEEMLVEDLLNEDVEVEEEEIEEAKEDSFYNPDE